MNELDKAYLAGMIDADGTIGRGFTPQVVVVNTYKPLIDRLCRSTNTSVVKQSTRLCPGDCKVDHIHRGKQKYRWRVMGGRAFIVLFNLAPYLEEKRPLAMAALKTGWEIRPREKNELMALGWEYPHGFSR